ncbi:unnamed protein product, partial [Rotaria sp. Silwood2]
MDYDAYGVKIAMNEVLLIQAQSAKNPPSVFIQFAPYNNTQTSLQCSINYSDILENYIYSVAVVSPMDFQISLFFVFDSENLSTLEPWHGNLTWPNRSFIPHAVDISNNFGIIVGFIQNDPQERVKYSPIIYLLNFLLSNHLPIVVHRYIPIATNGTWQDLLSNADADIYSSKYDMSVSINRYGDVLVGMQHINRVFLLSVNISNPIQLTY